MPELDHADVTQNARDITLTGLAAFAQNQRGLRGVRRSSERDWTKTISITDQTTGVAYASVSAAISDSAPGDVILLSAGTYIEDFPKITHSLTIEGVGGLAHLEPVGQPSNGEAILVVDAPSVTLDNLELSGATVADGNGAGVRFESGGTLTISNSWIHDNQEGLLTGAIAGASVSITGSEFDDNGTGTGNTHNIYIGAIASFSIVGSYVHDALGGHEIKSRAAVNVIAGNRIEDDTADTSYSIDLPVGGTDTISGNVIEKGPNSPNSAVIHFGGEQTPVDTGSSLVVSGNTITDDRDGGTPVLVLNQSVDASGLIAPVTVTGNTLYGIAATQFSNAAVTATSNITLPLPGPALDSAPPFTLACFAGGTRIRAATGDVPVEQLRVGDRVVSAFGGMVPLRWLGHRRVACHRHPRPEAVWPVRVRAGAIAPGVPARDLLLSPDHAVYCTTARVLVPVRQLVNGCSIVVQPMAEVVYHHLELPVHDVIFAEGLTCESYLDTGNRAAFDNGGDVTMLQPEFARREFSSSVWEAQGCAPLIEGGAAVVALRRRVLARAREMGGRLGPDAAPMLYADGRRLRGVTRDNVVTCEVPAGVRALHLVSRSWVPAWFGAPDARRLGVAVSHISCAGQPVGIGDARLCDGWHAPEVDGAGRSWRWTDGSARLTLREAGPLQLGLTLAGRYWQQATAARASA